MKRIARTCLLAAAAGLFYSATPVIAEVLTTEQASQRFKQGEVYERKHDLRSALDAYTVAGEAGHPLAQKKLGDLYSTGNAAVARDYEVALKWYQKARDQGVEIPSPFNYPATPVLGAPR
jgi:TPR repeat protein